MKQKQASDAVAERQAMLAGLDMLLEIELGDGAPDVEIDLPRRSILLSKNIGFEKNKAKMVAGTDDILAQIAKVCVTMQAVCQKHANDPLHVRFNVEGHTNCSKRAERGAASHLELSRYRAKAVCKALKKR